MQKGFLNMINPDTGRIHSSFNQAVTATGRISSTEPNLQNIPVKLEMGREIRKVFVPENDDFLLADADYSQIELRVLAHIAGDENMRAAFLNDEDIHTATAAGVFRVPKEEVTPLMRTRAKAVNSGIVYGIGDFSLSRDLGITRKQARKYIDDYLGEIPRCQGLYEKHSRLWKTKGLCGNDIRQKKIPAGAEILQLQRPVLWGAGCDEHADPGNCCRHHQNRDGQRI